MRALIDTNVIIDVLTQREPYFTKSAEVMELCKRGLIEGVICAQSYATIAYIMSKGMSLEDMYSSLEKLREICYISVVDEEIITNAIKFYSKDLEDAIQYFSAISMNVDCIITRDKTGFCNFPIPVFTPDELMKNCR